MSKLFTPVSRVQWRVYSSSSVQTRYPDRPRHFGQIPGHRQLDDRSEAPGGSSSSSPPSTSRLSPANDKKQGLSSCISFPQAVPLDGERKPWELNGVTARYPDSTRLKSMGLQKGGTGRVEIKRDLGKGKRPTRGPFLESPITPASARMAAYEKWEEEEKRREKRAVKGKEKELERDNGLEEKREVKVKKKKKKKWAFWVSGLRPDVALEEVKAAFKRFGMVDRVILLPHTFLATDTVYIEDSSYKGYAYVWFTNEEAAVKCYDSSQQQPLTVGRGMRECEVLVGPSQVTNWDGLHFRMFTEGEVGLRHMFDKWRKDIVLIAIDAGRKQHHGMVWFNSDDAAADAFTQLSGTKTPAGRFINLRFGEGLGFEKDRVEEKKMRDAREALKTDDELLASLFEQPQPKPSPDVGKLLMDMDELVKGRPRS